MLIVLIMSILVDLILVLFVFVFYVERNIECKVQRILYIVVIKSDHTNTFTLKYISMIDQKIYRIIQYSKIVWINSEFSFHPKTQIEYSVPLNDSNSTTSTDNDNAFLGVNSSELSVEKERDEGQLLILTSESEEAGALPSPIEQTAHYQRDISISSMTGATWQQP